MGSLLVGADGVKSVIRGELMEVDNRHDTGVSAIAGKVSLPGRDVDAILAPPVRASAVVIGDAPAGAVPDDVEEAGSERLLATVDEMTPAWHPRLKHLMRSADPASVMLPRYVSSHPPQPWAAMPVTLLGDAVHSMPPTGGEGANMALKDAPTLCKALPSSSGGALREGTFATRSPSTRTRCGVTPSRRSRRP